MPVSICPRCKHVNPDYAVYCHFDGVVLQAQQSAAVHRLPKEFKFPSGRRCNTFDELAQGCQEEWAAARDLLMRDEFAKFFRGCKRDDLVRAANDAKSQANPDIGLTTLLGALPGTATQTPKVDLNPRRILLGKVSVGETKTVPLTITNQGQGLLQGTITVTEGQDWLSLSDTKPVHELEVNAPREQGVKLTIRPQGVAAGQNYGARLTVVTNGGVVEVPLRMELVAQPFAKAPFQGARTQRELAEKMRKQPKAAVPVLESGEVQRWFALNGWTYPIHGAPIKGLAVVAQFFEGVGVSTPPIVKLSKKELRLTCKYKETVRAQVTLQTGARKWVYAHLTSDSPWLKLPLAQVAGPQNATISLEVDTSLWTHGPSGEGKVLIEANGGQKLALKVIVEVQGAPAGQKPKPTAPPAPTPKAPAMSISPPSPPTPKPPPVSAPISAGPPPASKPPPAPPSPAFSAGPPPAPPAPTSAPTSAPMAAAPTGALKYIPAFATVVIVCLLLRIGMVPFVDMWGRSSVSASAAAKLGVAPDANSDFAHTGGWLQLPWLAILASSNGEATIEAKVFQSESRGQIRRVDFGHYFVTYFIRWFVLRTWWLGAVFGAIFVLRRGGSTLDIPWGIVAGAMAGFAVSATVAGFFLVVEMAPHVLWQILVGEKGGFGFLILWIVFAVLCWLFVGIGLGVVLPLIAPLRRLLIDPFQWLIAATFDRAGMKPMAAYWSPD